VGWRGGRFDEVAYLSRYVEPSAWEKARTGPVVPRTERGLEDEGSIEIREVLGTLAQGHKWESSDAAAAESGDADCENVGGGGPVLVCIEKDLGLKFMELHRWNKTKKEVKALMAHNVFASRPLSDKATQY
jgi:hypothetical protein